MTNVTYDNKFKMILPTERGRAEFYADDGYVWVVNYDTTDKGEVVLSAKLVKFPPES